MTIAIGKRSSVRLLRVTRPRLFVGVLLIAIFCVQYQLSLGSDARVHWQPPIVRPAEPMEGDPFDALMRRDPLAALIEARAQHLRDVVDYKCVMVKQELLPDGMSQEQEIKVKFRQAPYSIYMEWVRNPGMATRVIYVKGRWTDSAAQSPDERELAIAQPGIIARVFVKSVRQPIHGRLAKKSSRRCIDEFGFEKTLDQLITICEAAKSRGELSLEFCGESRFEDRPVWVIRRQLPYTGEGGMYPDCMAEILVDKVYRVPVAVYCYTDADRQPNHLIARYEYRSVRMRVGLTEKHFDPSTYGM